MGNKRREVITGTNEVTLQDITEPPEREDKATRLARVEYAAKCPHCEMPLTAEQASQTHCMNCRSPLNEIIQGFIPKRCNACGATMPTEAETCPKCGTFPLKRRNGVEGYRETVEQFPDGRTVKPAVLDSPYFHDDIQSLANAIAENNSYIPEEYKQRLREGAWALLAEARGFTFSGPYLTDEMADFIITRIGNAVLTAVSTQEFHSIFNAGFIFELQGEERRVAREFVRHVFRAY